MSYQVLARKWRPRRFEEVVGQVDVLRALTHALEQQRLHHAYLFSGTRGVGKTTLGRILAKCLNCDKGVTASPCGECSVCLGVDAGNFIDLVEVDAASRAKVEETRDLMENVHYAPSMARYKVYLIDEVHMFSKHSFNALLKTLEEPPEHAKFLLATTEPEKLPVTILSRCLQFNLRALTVKQISKKLVDILAQEKVEFDDQSITLIAKGAKGSMRDALSLLDQAIAHGQGKLQAADVRQMLGAVDNQDLAELIAGLIDRDGEKMLQAVEQISLHSPNYDLLLTELLSLLQKAAVRQFLPDTDPSLYPLAIELADKLTAEELQLFYQIVLKGREDLAISPEPRVGFEMIMIRLLAFVPTGFDSTIASVPPKQALDNKPLPPSNAPTPVENTHNTRNNEWAALLEQMAPSAPVKQIASRCILLSKTPDKIELALKTKEVVHEKMLQNSYEALQSALKAHLGEQVTLVINEIQPSDVADGDKKTPNEMQQADYKKKT